MNAANLQASIPSHSRAEGGQTGRGVRRFSRVIRYPRSTRAVIGAVVFGVLDLAVRKG